MNFMSLLKSWLDLRDDMNDRHDDLSFEQKQKIKKAMYDIEYKIETLLKALSN